MRGKLTMALLVLLVGGAAALRAQEAGPPYEVGGEVSRPENISSAGAAYTEAARRERVSGIVLISAVINEKGNVTEPRVLKGLPLGLNETALAAVSQWKYKPAMRHGQPVPVKYMLAVKFRVNGPYEGGVFIEFLENNPEFAKHFRRKHFERAEELLDRGQLVRHDDSVIALARIYLLIEQEKLEEARKSAYALRKSISESGNAERLQPVSFDAQRLEDLVTLLQNESEG
jgi:TonB family protein